MKNLSFINKIIFFINNIFALLFLASFAIPFIPPKTLPILSVLSLAVPLLLFIHILFIIYWWLAGVKKQFLLSAFCILLAIFFSNFPYKFSEKNIISGNSFSIMNYNVRLFNKYQWIEDDNIPQKISDLIKQNDPDILTLQELYPSTEIDINYPYTVGDFKGNNKIFGQAIFSKFEIINKGSLDFNDTDNNAIYIDILKGSDTIRIYNLHLESLGIKPYKDFLGEKDSEKMIKRLSNSFVKQQEQVEKFNIHKDKCKYKIIISGDFNNTAYSWAYREIKGNLTDTFLVSGKGFGKTYDFNKYPLRIDFLLVDKYFKVNQHKNFDVKYSDHFPVLAKISH